MKASMPQAASASDRLVIRPLQTTVVANILVFGFFALGFAAVAIYTYTRGHAAGLIALLPSALALVGIYGALGGTLWADSTGFGTTTPWQRVNLSRTGLAGIHIGRYLPRYGTPCIFVRSDGSVGLRLRMEDWGKDQIATLANFLSVPLIDDSKPATYTCPICGYPGLEEPATSNGVGSHELCPSCGFEFVGRIDQPRYDQWRAQWVAGGMSWWAANAGRPAPKDWDPAAQLKALRD